MSKLEKLLHTYGIRSAITDADAACCYLDAEAAAGEELVAAETVLSSLTWLQQLQRRRH